MSDAPDRELWVRARDGDAEAFGHLFERHSGPIYNYCFRRTADWALAEDLTSVTFLLAWRGLPREPLQAGSALPLLYGIATNVLRNQRRSLNAAARRSAVWRFLASRNRTSPRRQARGSTTRRRCARCSSCSRACRGASRT